MFLNDLLLTGVCGDILTMSHAWVPSALGTASVPVNNSEPAAATSTAAEKLDPLRRVVVV